MNLPFNPFGGIDTTRNNINETTKNNFIPSGQQHIPINVEQFKQLTSNIDNNFLEELVQVAKQQGISEQDIKNGLTFLKNMK